jgi:hypothetical protein
MARKRKTKAEQEAGRARVAAGIWRIFEEKLRAALTLKDAQMLAQESLPQDSPGRPFYSNLGFFLQGFSREGFIVPMGSSGEEKRLYAQFIDRLAAAGVSIPGGRDKVVGDLMRGSDRVS